MRLLPRSLHARMLALSAAAALVALIVAGWTIAGVLGRFVTEGLDQRLDSEVTMLASVVDTNGHVDRDKLSQRLGVLRGERGWRWQIRSPDGTIGSADFPTLDAGPPHPPLDGPGRFDPPPPSDDRMHPLDGATEHGVRIYARQLTIDTLRGPVTLTAAAPRDVVRRPIRGALTPLLIALAALAGLLGAATLVQLRLGLRPLRRLRDQVADIRTGARATVDEEQPSELQPLAVELNALAKENAAALATARLSAANLAHALKTPVATLALDLRDEPARAALVARIDTTIRHHLARARADAVNRRASTILTPALTDLARTVRELHRERSLDIEVESPSDLSVAVDPQDLDEMVGNLLDNAARHAASTILIRSAKDGDHHRRVRIEVCDDGPGISASDRAHAIQPGTKLDERGSGHGFGLAIVVELAALYGGKLTLDGAEGGGLRAVLVLPAGI